MTIAKRKATLEDLHNAPDDGYKYELVNGELERMPPPGEVPMHTAFEIASILRVYAKRIGRGYAYSGDGSYAVNLPHRQSISPDASFVWTYDRANMDFAKIVPVFAVEVRSKSDYGPAMNRKYAAKRVDYFAVGTEVVWDVDPIAQTVAKYVGDPETPVVTYGTGETADAEPALPGWRVAVDDLFA